jgi:hypothetical protein
MGGLKNEVIRNEFIDLTSRIALGHVTAPKTLRHTFATILQDANVDPLIRNELMGHVPSTSPGTWGGARNDCCIHAHSPGDKTPTIGERLCRPRDD